MIIRLVETTRMRGCYPYGYKNAHVRLLTTATNLVRRNTSFFRIFVRLTPREWVQLMITSAWDFCWDCAKISRIITFVMYYGLSKSETCSTFIQNLVLIKFSLCIVLLCRFLKQSRLLEMEIDTSSCNNPTNMLISPLVTLMSEIFAIKNDSHQCASAT